MTNFFQNHFFKISEKPLEATDKSKVQIVDLKISNNLLTGLSPSVFEKWVRQSRKTPRHPILLGNIAQTILSKEYSRFLVIINFANVLVLPLKWKHF